MSVNGITGASGSYDVYQTAAASTAKEASAAENTKTAEGTKKAEESGVVYEPAKDAEKVDSTKKTYTQNTALVDKLKSDAEARAQQLQNIVQQLMTKQGQTYNTANDIWKFLAKGDFEVDAATKAQAQADIADDGYWGVEQTSDRIIDFANALTGGDPDKIEDMRAAFTKGYEQAEKTWGEKLPEISQKTYDAVMQKFDKLAEDAKQTSQTVDQTTSN